jgi:hypothetical protein
MVTSPHSPPTPRRTLAVVALSLAILAALVLAAAGIGYWVYSRTPTFALQQAARSVRRHDLGTFERYVDLDGVAGSLVDAWTAGPRPARGPQGGWDAAGEALGRAVIGLARPRLVQHVAERIRRQVEDTGRPDALQGSHVRLRDVERRGGAATATVEVSRPDGSVLTAHLRMRERDGRWQVAEILDAADIAGHLRRPLLE